MGQLGGRAGMPSTLLLALLGALPLRAEGGKKRKGGADYYDILGVKEKDDAATIKKAYRAKSLLYHPDKCEEDKDACQAKFIEVSTAYEVLTDPEKRKVYDRDGEEGLKDGGGGGEQARQMFRQFFGREPDGDVKIVKDRFGRMTFQEMGEPGPKEDIFGDTNVTELTDDVYSSFVNERTEPVIVMFYKPNDDDSVEAKPEYAAFCNTFQSFLMVASVNCRQQRSVCKQASIDSFPAIRWFPEEKSAPPEVYDAAFSAKAIGKWVSSMMPDYSKVLEDKHALRQWLDDAKGPAVLLFTDKSSSPPMWKALSREFKGKVSLAVVLRCDKNGVFKTPLQREYDVRVPSIVRLDPLDDVGKIAEKFDHQLKQEVLKIWLLKVLSQGRKAGPVATFKEWSRQRYEAGDCGPSDSQFCFLWLKAGADAEAEEATKQLAQKYRTDPIKLMWANVELNPSLLEAFDLESSEASDHFVAFRPKRQKFKVHEGPLRFKELDNFVDGVLSGGPLGSKLKVPRIEL